MTALTEDTQLSVAEVANGYEQAEPRPKPAPVRRRVLAISALVLAAAVVAAVVFVVFEGPIERSWYRLRQRALTSDFNGAHAHSGVGHAIAVLQIPRLRVSTVVAEGDSSEQLRGGPGHSTKTPAPNAPGNVVIFGHRQAWGGPFSTVADLRPNDLIAVEAYAPDGTLQTGVYTVQSVKPASSSDTWPFATSKDHRLTLVTSRDGRFSSDRLVVTAVSGPALRSATGASASFAPASNGSTLTSASSLLLAIGILGALVVRLVLGRRYGRVPVAVAIAPFAVMALLGALLDVDMLLPALR